MMKNGAVYLTENDRPPRTMAELNERRRIEAENQRQIDIIRRADQECLTENQRRDAVHTRSAGRGSVKLPEGVNEFVQMRLDRQKRELRRQLEEETRLRKATHVIAIKNEMRIQRLEIELAALKFQIHERIR